MLKALGRSDAGTVMAKKCSNLRGNEWSGHTESFTAKHILRSMLQESLLEITITRAIVQQQHVRTVVRPNSQDDNLRDFLNYTRRLR